MDLEKIRQDFPILQKEVNNHRLVYFDNAATTQKPQIVIDEIAKFYENSNANVHRGIHHLSCEATDKYEEAREVVQRFINAKSNKEVIFTRGTTETINLVANILANTKINKDDEIIISTLEHHSNIVPWQILCEKVGAKLKIIPIKDNGELDLDKFADLLSDKTKLIAVNQVSNSIGIINNIEKIITTAKNYNKDILVLIDGAQAIAHMPVDVQNLDCDFYAFSGHKIFGPTGIGVLYGKEALLKVLPPWHGGGEMIDHVSFEKTTYADLPQKYEAGTPNFVGAWGMATGIKYLLNIGFDNIAKYEQELTKYTREKLLTIPNLRIIGDSKNKIAVFSFVIDGAHPQDIGLLIDQFGIAIRTGHHCTMPLFQFFGIEGTARISLSFYNTREEVDYFIEKLTKVLTML